MIDDRAAKAWAIFNKHPNDRAEALAACAKAGINPSTAKTQWQRWLHASKAQRAAKANSEKKTHATQEAAAQS